MTDQTQDALYDFYSDPKHKDFQKAFENYTQILEFMHPYGPRSAEAYKAEAITSVFVPDDLPMGGEMLNVLGAGLGYSESVGHLILQLSDYLTAHHPVDGLFFWYCPNEEIEGQNNIIAGFSAFNGQDTYIAGGMTNYSGSGGAAYETMETVLQWIACIYGLNIERKTLTNDFYEDVDEAVNAMIKISLEEKEENEA